MDIALNLWNTKGSSCINILVQFKHLSQNKNMFMLTDRYYFYLQICRCKELLLCTNIL